MKYRSKFEKTVGDVLLKKGAKYEAERIYYNRPSTYLPDFRLPNGIYIEAKGKFTSSDRGKHLLIRQQNPTVDIRFVFQNPFVRLSKLSKTTYADWCEKHGFLWCKGPTIPKEWTK